MDDSNNDPSNRFLPDKPVIKVFAIFKLSVTISIFKAFMPDNIVF